MSISCEAKTVITIPLMESLPLNIMYSNALSVKCPFEQDMHFTKAWVLRRSWDWER